MANNIKKGKHELKIDLEVFLLHDENGLFVSYCPALELSSYGENIEDAKKAFNEALEIFIEDTNQKGTFERVLLELGWTLSRVPKFNFEPPRINAKDISKMSKTLIDTTKVAIPYC
jgi:predicted RNase H-like HicB family nuclease